MENRRPLHHRADLVSLPIAVTDRVTLRQWRTSDAVALVEEANSRDVWRNLIHTFPHPYTNDDAIAWIERCRAQDPPRDIVIAGDDRLIGACGVTLGSGVSVYTGSVGYWLGESHWGNGIATAVFGVFLGYIWDTFQVERLQAEVFAWNPASIRVLEKNGFQKEGTRRSAIYKDGELIDESFFSLLRSEVE